MLTRVMRDVRGPEPADAVRGAVEPVVAELDQHEDRDHGPAIHRDVEQPILVYPNLSMAPVKSNHVAASAI